MFVVDTVLAHPAQALIALAALFAIYLAVNVAIDYERAVVYRLGRFVGLRGPGLYFLIPFIESQRVIDTRIVTADVGEQESMTLDNVPVKANTVIWYRVVDPGKAVNTVADIRIAVVQLALTTLRAELGRNNLDAVLKDQTGMAERIQREVDRVTERWGIEISRVEMRQVEIPPTMQRAMAQVAEALREKQARVIKAEAEFEAARKLQQAAALMAGDPVALELRRLQMITEVGAEQNTSTIMMIPAEFLAASRGIGEVASRAAAALERIAPAPAAKPAV